MQPGDISWSSFGRGQDVRFQAKNSAKCLDGGSRLAQKLIFSGHDVERTNSMDGSRHVLTESEHVSLYVAQGQKLELEIALIDPRMSSFAGNRAGLRPCFPFAIVGK